MMRDGTVAQAGQKRRAPPAIGTNEAGRTPWLLCRTAAVLYALPLERVIEIMRLLPVEQIGVAPKYIRGLSVIRGAPVPVVDLGLIVGDHVSHCTRLIAVRAAKRTIALAVEAVIGVTAIAADAFGQLPPLLRDAAVDTVSAIGASDTELIVFLHAARLVPEAVLASLSATEAAS
jgi:purine-binding chemotaxis protein CheW